MDLNLLGFNVYLDQGNISQSFHLGTFDKKRRVMNVNQFITRFSLKPADAIVLNKKIFGMVDHYVIYLGLVRLQHQFVANYIGGVRIISNHEIGIFLKTYEPTKVEKFPGGDDQRKEAIKRAMSQIGEKAYDYLANNCEHFKNFVHYGIKESTQVQKAGAVIVTGGLGLTIMGAGKKNDGMTMLGILVIFIGIITVLLGVPDKEEKKRKVRTR